MIFSLSESEDIVVVVKGEWGGLLSFLSSYLLLLKGLIFEG